MRKGCQEGYDEKEEDVLHGCGCGAILEYYVVSSMTTRFVPEGGFVA